MASDAKKRQSDLLPSGGEPKLKQRKLVNIKQSSNQKKKVVIAYEMKEDNIATWQSSQYQNTKLSKSSISYFDTDLDDEQMIAAVNVIEKSKRKRLDQTKTRQYHRLQVIEVFKNESDRVQILTGINKEKKKFVVELRQDWFESDINIQDVINVIVNAEQSTTSNEFANSCIIVDNTHNLVVVHPDYLVIPSRIAASYPCPRTQVLAHNIQSFQENATSLYGIMAHELFQKLLHKGLKMYQFFFVFFFW